MVVTDFFVTPPPPQTNRAEKQRGGSGAICYEFQQIAGLRSVVESLGRRVICFSMLWLSRWGGFIIAAAEQLKDQFVLIQLNPLPLMLQPLLSAASSLHPKSVQSQGGDQRVPMLSGCEQKLIHASTRAGHQQRVINSQIINSLPLTLFSTLPVVSLLSPPSCSSSEPAASH